MRIEYIFDGLPLEVRDDGACAAFVDGVADIDTSRDGRWHVASVQIRFGVHVPNKASVYRLEVPGLWITAQVMTTLEHSPLWHARVTQHIEKAGQPVNLEDHRFRRAYLRKVEV